MECARRAAKRRREETRSIPNVPLPTKLQFCVRSTPVRVPPGVVGQSKLQFWSYRWQSPLHSRQMVRSLPASTSPGDASVHYHFIREFCECTKMVVAAARVNLVLFGAVHRLPPSTSNARAAQCRLCSLHLTADAPNGLRLRPADRRAKPAMRKRRNDEATER